MKRYYKKSIFLILGVMFIAFSSTQYIYASSSFHCWNCGSYNQRYNCYNCSVCGWDICAYCGACYYYCPGEQYQESDEQYYSEPEIESVQPSEQTSEQVTTPIIANEPVSTNADEYIAGEESNSVVQNEPVVNSSLDFFPTIILLAIFFSFLILMNHFIHGKKPMSNTDEIQIKENSELKGCQPALQTTSNSAIKKKDEINEKFAMLKEGDVIIHKKLGYLYVTEINNDRIYVEDENRKKRIFAKGDALLACISDIL